MDRPSIHVVIVNWNAGTMLKECLESFSNVQADGADLRITVVDNASTDKSCDGLNAPVPLSIIKKSRNVGFGAACNEGAAGTDAEFLLFLNPDTRLMPGSLIRPAQYLRTHPSIGIVGIQLLDA